jgi:hypothetical protein
MTRRWRARGAWILALLMLGAASGITCAEDADPPGRAARLSDAEGSVSLQPAGVQDWTAAALNRPLTTGDRLWSDQSSRAELDLGTAAVRLGSNTGFAFLNLDDRSVQMQLSAGALIVSVRDIPNGESYEIDTPNIALTLQQPGVYRIEVNDQGTATAVGVSQGLAQAAGGGQTVAVGSQQLVTFSGTDMLAWQTNTLGAPDQFDDWSALRERQAAESASAGYVASDVPGAQDLDHNGEWQQTPEYGNVWVPTAVVAGWVPYRYGQWVWVTPWGWTWIDDAPWGYAPFHYGRWVVWKNSWCWVPTPRHAMHGRAVYAPALVAWVGTVPGAGVVPGSHVSWFPLGPREVYVPPYRVSTTYVRTINITNTTITDTTYITNVYQNKVTPQHYANNTANAVTTVPRSTFTSGQRVGPHTLQASTAPLGAAAMSTAAPAIVPTRQSVLGTVPAHAVARPPAALMQRTLIARSAPPPAPVSFERQIGAIEADGGRPPTRSELALLQHAASLTPVKVLSGRAAQQPAAVTQATPAMQSLAERERVLQQSAFPSAPRVPPVRSAVRSEPYAPPAELRGSAPPSALRADRPPSAQQHPRESQQPVFTADDAAHPPERPAAIPVYQFPPGAAAPARVPGTMHPDESYRSVPPSAVRPAAAPHGAAPVPAPSLPAPPVAHPPPPTPTHGQTSRDSAPSAPRTDPRDHTMR